MQVAANGFSGTFITVPVVDGDFIVERPVETITKGRLNAVSLMHYYYYYGKRGYHF